MKFLGYNITKDQPKMVNPMTVANAEMAESYTRLWKVSDDRRTIYKDIDRMYNMDNRTANAVDVLVDYCVAQKSIYDPWIEIVTEQQRHKELITALHKQAGIAQNLKTIYHGFIKHGNRFGELVMREGTFQFDRLNIVRDTWSIYRNEDQFGQLLSGDPAQANRRPNFCAYDQRDESGNVLENGCFYPWQILHWRMNPIDKDGHGTAFLKTARSNWLRLDKEEDHLVIARLTRAFSKYVHTIAGAEDLNIEDQEKLIKMYKASLEGVKIEGLDNSTLTGTFMKKFHSVLTDFFLVNTEKNKGDVKLLDPSNPQLQNIADVEHIQNLHFMRLKVPKALLGYELDINAKATLTGQNEGFAKTIYSLQYDCAVGLIELTNRLLLFAGVDPNSFEYQLILPSPFVQDAATQALIEHREAWAGQILIRNNIISRDTYRRDWQGMDETASADEEAKVKREADLFPPAVSNTMFPTDEEVLKQIYQIKEYVKHNHNGHGGYDHKLARVRTM